MNRHCEGGFRGITRLAAHRCLFEVRGIQCWVAGKIVLNTYSQQEWIYDDLLKLKPAQESGPEFERWQLLAQEVEAELSSLAAHASRMFPYEQRGVRDLLCAGAQVVRVAGSFPGNKFLQGMNFLNGEGGGGAEDKPFFVTNGGDPRAEQYVAKQYLIALGTGLKRLYFIDPAASKASIEQTNGGLGCRTKGEGTVQRVAGIEP